MSRIANTSSSQSLSQHNVLQSQQHNATSLGAPTGNEPVCEPVEDNASTPRQASAKDSQATLQDRREQARPRSVQPQQSVRARGITARALLKRSPVGQPDKKPSQPGQKSSQKTAQRSAATTRIAGDTLPAATPEAKARQLAQQYDLNASAQSALAKALTWMQPTQWDRADALVGPAKQGTLASLLAKPYSSKTNMALVEMLVQNPECARQLQSLLSHPGFASQDSTVQIQLLTAASTGKQNKAVALLSSGDFQKLNTQQKRQAGHMLLASSQFNASRINGAFAQLARLKEQFKIWNPNSGIGRASLANTAADALKVYPEIYQALGLQERFSVMSVMLGQLGVDGKTVTSATQRDVLRAVKALKVDNGVVADAFISKTLEVMRGGISWDAVLKNQGAAVLGQMINCLVPGDLPGFLMNKAYSSGVAVATNRGSMAAASSSYMEATMAVGIAEWVGGMMPNLGKSMLLGSTPASWLVTGGVVLFEQFKGFMLSQANKVEASQAEGLLRRAGLLRCMIPN